MDPLLFRNLLAHASQAALVAAGGALVARALVRLHPQVTLSLWQAVLLATAIMPFAQPWTPVTSQLAITLQVGGTSIGQDAVVRSVMALPGLALPTVAALLVAGVLARLAWILVGLWRLRRLAVEAVPCCPLPEALRAAMRDANVRADFREAEIAGPVSFGLRRGVIVLPRNLSQLGRDTQYLIARHELIHVRRRDALQCLFEEMLVAAFWFYPWIWWIRGRIRLAREQAVDRATAPTRTTRGAYVRTLLNFSGNQPRALPTASGMWRAHELRARIDALYKEVTMSRSRLFVGALAAAAVVGGAAVLGAAVFPLYSAPAPDASARTPAVATKAFPVAAQQSSDDDVVRIGGDVKPPKKIKHVSPVYPPDAKEAGIEGIVILEAVIDKEGKVARADIVRSIPELDQAALDAVLQWEFEPTYIKGKAVAVRMTVTINFTLA